MLGVARHSESKQRLVVYHPSQDPDDLWARPLDMWGEAVLSGDIPTPRFQLIEEAPTS